MLKGFARTSKQNRITLWNQALVCECMYHLIVSTMTVKFFNQIEIFKKIEFYFSLLLEAECLSR